MKLYIDTASQTEVIIELREGKSVVASRRFKAPHQQAEKLLPAMETLLKAKRKKLSDIKEIIVQNKGEGFTSLRIGVITANALSFALGIKISSPDKRSGPIIAPEYSRPPSITQKK